jgi:hypothetical protein
LNLLEFFSEIQFCRQGIGRFLNEKRETDVSLFSIFFGGMPVIQPAVSGFYLIQVYHAIAVSSYPIHARPASRVAHSLI